MDVEADELYLYLLTVHAHTDTLAEIAALSASDSTQWFLQLLIRIVVSNFWGFDVFCC